MHRALRCLALLSGAVFFVPLPALAHDWAYWRGPEQTGVSREKDLPSRFSLDPKDPNNNVVWKGPYGGRSTPIIMHGRVYLNNKAGEGVHEQERVMCLDEKTGKLLWEKRFNVYHTDIVSLRLGWTNMCGDPETGNLYWHGTQGDFVCFDKDGKILWERQLTEQDGRVSGYGGRLNSPLVDGELVIMGMINSSWGDQGIGANRFFALNKRTGEPVWWTTVPGKPGTYASTCVVAVIKGQRLIVSGSSSGAIVAMNVYTGKLLWSYPFAAGVINATPVVVGDKVYVAHGGENLDTNVQGRVACLDAGEVTAGKPKLVWKQDGIKVRYTTPIVHEGRVYAADDQARLYCLDAETGKRLWRRPFAYGRNAMGSPVWADGKIYVGDVDSHFHILQPGAKGCKELHDQFFPGESDVEVAGNPAVANGRVYFLTHDEIYCIGKKGQPAKADPIPPPPKEAPVGEPAQVQLVPADLTLQPGDSARLFVHVLDKNGREVSKAEVAGTWSLPQPPPYPKAKKAPPKLQGTLEASATKVVANPDPKQGPITYKGATLTVSKALPSQQGLVMFHAGSLGVSTARVRVAPRLPYAQDFKKLPDGTVPAGWVNTQGKFMVATLKDGSKVLQRNNKVASPVVALANAYIGLPSMTNYTVEAEVKGTKLEVGRDWYMPDVGVGANRYTLALWGTTQRLRLTSWDAIPRVDVPLEYPWLPDTWYHLKLTVQVDGDKAVARGKVWKRGETEPKEWSVQYVDSTPNRRGAPTLYGRITGFVGSNPGNQAYYDNVRVYPNRKQ
jgi:outer membrane protein assembly factor BamB